VWAEGARRRPIFPPIVKVPHRPEVENHGGDTFSVSATGPRQNRHGAGTTRGPLELEALKAGCIAHRRFGNTLGPEDPYRFARGEEVISSTGQRVKLCRPLDFLVVADHAEGLGSTIELKNGNPLLNHSRESGGIPLMSTGPSRDRQRINSLALIAT
jgi:Protein of unknown function (DUF3604)